MPAKPQPAEPARRSLSELVHLRRAENGSSGDLHRMENTGWLDLAMGGLAIAILLGGIVMLLSGVAAMNQKK